MTNSREQPPVVVLAAGNGRRLVSRQAAIPKPLCRVGGVTLLDRVVSTFAGLGCRRVVVVVGYRADQIEAHLRATAQPASVETVYNPDYASGNGLSVLAARTRVNDTFILTMADHVFDARIPGQLLRQPPASGITLAIDRKPESVFDLDEATKARVVDGQVVQVGKTLDEFEAVDTGLFFAGRALMDALEDCRAKNQTALSDGVNRLARAGQVRAMDIGSAHWVDVDTPAARDEAERWLRSDHAAPGP